MLRDIVYTIHFRVIVIETRSTQFALFDWMKRLLMYISRRYKCINFISFCII